MSKDTPSPDRLDIKPFEARYAQFSEHFGLSAGDALPEWRVPQGAQTERGKWTMAISLSADLRNYDGDLSGGGNFGKWQQLKSLAESTANSPVSLVVSIPHTAANSRDLSDLRRQLGNPLQRVPAEAFDAGGDRPFIDTYLINNGQIRLLHTRTSDGLARDTEHLLRTAQTTAPSDRLGLTIFAHGYGTEVGMNSDTSNASTAEIRDAIQRGLGERGRLDLLNFDACRMASTDVASAMKDVARYMVASEDVEIADANGGFNGQNLGAALRRLIAAPDKTPQQLAQDLVAQADRGENGRPTRVPELPGQQRTGTDTLIAIDMDKYRQFERSLNELATVLQPRLENRADRLALARAIDLTPAFPTQLRPAERELRDTRQFAQKVLDQIRTGKLTDDGSIRRAAQNLLQAQDSMTERLHVNGSLFPGVGGVSTFLPVTSAASRLDLVRSRSMIPSTFADVPQYQRSIAGKFMVEANTAIALNVTSMGLTEQNRPQLSGLWAARERMVQAQTQEQYTTALSAMRRESDRFMSTPLARGMMRDLQRTMHPSNGSASRNEWAYFVDQLVTRSKEDR